MMKPDLDELLNNKYDSNKKYRVYVEINGSMSDGYICLKPEKVKEKTNNDYFLITYSFKTIGKKRNPLFSIEKLEGKDFPDRTDIINHFAKHNALRCAFEIDVGDSF